MNRHIPFVISFVIFLVGCQAISADSNVRPASLVCTAYCIEKPVKVCAVEFPDKCTEINGLFCNEQVGNQCRLVLSNFTK